MKTIVVIIISIFITHITVNAQRVFSSYDVSYSPAFSVNDMNPNEIQCYNDWIKDGESDTLAISMINAGRAWENLKQAPATIINLVYNGKIEQKDSLSQYNGAQKVWFEIINSTTKTIKSITISVEFEDNKGNKVYDTKTGKQTMTIAFNNLAGRCSSSDYNEITKTIINCYYAIGMKDAVSCSPFYNENCDACSISSVSIVYDDGSKSNLYSVFYGEDMYLEGPLKPLTVYLHNINAD